MITAIPTDTDQNDTPVCVSFARAPYFLFHDSQTCQEYFVSNPAADASGGAGVKAAQFLLDQHTDALITVRAGENAAEALLAAGVTILKASGQTAFEELKAQAEGRLEPLRTFHAGFHGHV